MSMFICSACDKERDSDFVEFEVIDGKEVCESCLAAIPEPPAPAPFIYWSTDCAECGNPATQGSAYCSTRCRKIATGTPSMQEQALNL